MRDSNLESLEARVHLKLWRKLASLRVTPKFLPSRHAQSNRLRHSH
jgi:hypothetical protein